MKKICILAFSLLILFASYSCIQKSGTGPKGEEYTLKLTADYYGTDIIAADENAISVKVYKTKDDLDSDNVEIEYTSKDFINEIKPVSIVENSEVVIKLNKRASGDFTDISGDVADDFDSTSEELQFTMDGDKSFEVIFSTVKIEMYEFTFEASAGGSLKINQTAIADSSVKTTMVDAGKKETIKISSGEFIKNILSVIAEEDEGYIFDGWSDNTIVGNSFIVSDSMKGKTIKANFYLDPITTVTFKANVGGDVVVTIKKLSDGSTKVTTINSGTEGTVDIGESKFNTSDYSITANGRGSSGHIFEKWSGYTTGITTTSDSFTVVKAMGSKTIEASFISSTTSPVTFKASTGGSITVVVKDSGNNTVQTATINAEATTPVQIADSRFGNGFTITATANANANYDFSSWSGAGTSGTAPIRIGESHKNQTITASFTEQMQSFTFKANANGTIVVKDGNTVLGTAPAGGANLSLSISKVKIAANAITATPTPSVNYSFGAWSVGTTGTANPLTVLSTMTGVITATFTDDMQTFTFKANANGTIVVKEGTTTLGTAPAGGTNLVLSISKVKIAANAITATPTPSANYAFSAWSVGTTGSNNPLTVTTAMTGVITASFREITKTITLTSGANGEIYLNFINRSTGAMISNKIIAASSSWSTTLTASFLTSQIVEARASGNFVSPDYYVINQWNDNSTLEARELDMSSPTTMSVSFKTGDIIYGAGTAPSLVSGWYEIYNKEHLLYVANQVNAGNSTFKTGKYKLMNDIDYGGTYHLPVGVAGNTAKIFTGVMNGNNKVIKNAKFGSVLNLTTYSTGFIGHMTNGVISNLTIDSSVVINTRAFYAGSIVANGKDISIYNSVNKADIYNQNPTSGSYCMTGGIIGGIDMNTFSIISNVYNTGNISANSPSEVRIGGIAGSSFVTGLVVKNAYNTGNITFVGSHTSSAIGGIFGYSSSINITNVYSTGTINSSGGTTLVGGVFGSFFNAQTVQAANVYFTGNASLPAGGFGSGSQKTTGINGRIASLSGYQTTFNSVAGMAGVWANGPNGRPVIVGLPAE